MAADYRDPCNFLCGMIQNHNKHKQFYVPWSLETKELCKYYIHYYNTVRVSHILTWPLIVRIEPPESPTLDWYKRWCASQPYYDNTLTKRIGKIVFVSWSWNGEQQYRHQATLHLHTDIKRCNVFGEGSVTWHEKVSWFKLSQGHRTVHGTYWIVSLPPSEM
jgi:hypothetical protein